MTLVTDVRTYQFKALTDLWTGSVMDNNGRVTDKPTPYRLITTGLLGSIRWWFEVLVRGLGGNACDPSPEDRKENPPECRCPNRKIESANDPGHHCVVCELFGCTGWARKFRFEVLDANGNTKTDQIKGPDPSKQRQGELFSLRFTTLRLIRSEEWALLDATLRLIAEYGAIGGKTVLKPSNQNNRDRHKDYGLLRLGEPPKINILRNVLREHISQDVWRKPDHDGFAWASLQNFWCVNGQYLTRQNGNSSSFNRVIGRPESKQRSGQNDSWIAGRRPDRRNNVEAESKKMFSFKNPARTFGFVKPGRTDADIKKEFEEMKKRLDSVWGQNGWNFLAGGEIIDQLLAGKEDRS